MPRKKALPTGIRFYGNGYQTFAKVGAVQMPRKSWPIDTPLEDMEQAIRDWKKTATGADAAASGFAADIDTYCERKAALASIGLRRQHLEFIAEKLGADRSRHSITATELDSIFANLETEGAAVSTVHNYRASIRNFFNVMDPRRFNPVKETTVATIPEGGAKGRRIEVIESIMANLSNRGKARHRIVVMKETGIPPALLKKVKATDLRPNPEAPVEIQISPRRKGKGVAARTLPLTADGSQAFAAFHRANAYGSFATTGLNAAFQLAASKAGVDDISVYALRHSFLSNLYRVTGDLATVADFAMHAPGSPLTAQYASAAREDVNAAAVVKFNAWMDRVRAAKAAGLASTQATQAAPVGVPPAVIEAARQAATQAALAAFNAAIEAASVAASAALPEAA